MKHSVVFAFLLFAFALAATSAPVQNVTDSSESSSLSSSSAFDSEGSYSGTCTKVTCATLGQSCFDASYSTDIECISVDSYCNETSCVSKIADGSACSSDAVCANAFCDGDGPSYNVTNGVCRTPTPLVDNGGACTTGDDCISSVCTNSLCVVLAAGDSCEEDENCGYNLYCGDGDVCTASIAVGAACDYDVESSQQCVAGAGCASGSSDTYVCTSLYSLSAGSDCDDSTFCAGGLACLDNADGTSSCGTVTASSLKACSSDSDCTATYEKCFCDQTDGSSKCYNPNFANPASIGTTTTQLNQCVAAHCTTTSDPTSCALKACPSVYCAAASDQIEVGLNFLASLAYSGDYSFADCYFTALKASVNAGISAQCANSGSTGTPSTGAPTPAATTTFTVTVTVQGACSDAKVKAAADASVAALGAGTTYTCSASKASRATNTTATSDIVFTGTTTTSSFNAQSIQNTLKSTFAENGVNVVSVSDVKANAAVATTSSTSAASPVAVVSSIFASVTLALMVLFL